jgi:hypothetical protein
MKQLRKILFAKTHGAFQRGIVATLCIVLIGFFMAASCEKPTAQIPSDNDKENTNTEAIEFSEYSLTQCHWNTWNTKNFVQDSVYIINSQEEFLMFISCDEDSMPAPIVDFNEYSLLLVRGGTTTGIESIAKTLQQLSIHKYELNIEITLNMAAIAEGWVIAILIPKLSQNTIIVLNKVEHF